MRLDAADLALLEIDAEHLDPLACEIVRMLLERIRELEASEEEQEKENADALAEAFAGRERDEERADELEEKVKEMTKQAKAAAVLIARARTDAALGIDLLEDMTA